MLILQTVTALVSLHWHPHGGKDSLLIKVTVWCADGVQPVLANTSCAQHTYYFKTHCLCPFRKGNIYVRKRLCTRLSKQKDYFKQKTQTCYCGPSFKNGHRRLLRFNHQLRNHNPVATDYMRYTLHCRLANSQVVHLSLKLFNLVQSLQVLLSCQNS